MENKVDYTLRKKYPLTDEQNEVLDFMLKKTKCVNACQTGFGKTYTCTSGLCHVLIKYPDTHAIILCPQKAVKAFKREFLANIPFFASSSAISSTLFFLDFALMVVSHMLIFL